VQLYQDAGCSTPLAVVLGGQTGKVKIRYGGNAEGEWKTRSVVANQMYVRKNDPAIAAASWLEIR
jgi:hypothetical protein